MDAVLPDEDPDDLHLMLGSAGLDLGDDEERPLRLEFINKCNNLSQSMNAYNALDRDLRRHLLRQLDGPHVRNYVLVAKRDVKYHRRVLIRHLVEMLKRGILPKPTPPPRLDMQVAHLLTEASLVTDAYRLAGGSAVHAIVDARAARQAAAAAAQAALAAAQADAAAAQAAADE